MRYSALLASALLILAGCCGPKDGEYNLHVLTTNDIHGTFFDSTYVDGRLHTSLTNVKYYVDSVRTAAGRDNVILIDAGDFLQGDNAAYYFNFVDTLTPHIFPRMAAYMGYDAVVAGNHDIETGHPVYDRLTGEFKRLHIPFLAGNAVRNDDGKPYFPVYTIVRRHGLKIAVLGFDNANIKAWLNENLWSGMHFESLLPYVQEQVDKVIEKEKPHLVIVAVHSGTGEGDGSVMENQGLDLYNSLTGVDVLICGHDHKPFVTGRGDMCLVNSGSHSRNIGHAGVSLTVGKGKVVSKSMSAALIPVSTGKGDAVMREKFHKDYEAVKAFTLKEVGELKSDLVLSDAFTGMSDYINFVHTVCLESSPAQISIVAPLAQRGVIKAGTLVYNDLFTLYQYENQLFLLTMSGKEIKDYLEVSYDQWINTVSGPGEHVLKISDTPDPRNGNGRWSFVNYPYNFDSMAGIVYTVDVTRPYGERIDIISMADGSGFDSAGSYKVAMTSYRASGGGGLLGKIGVDTDNIEDRVIDKYPEIRELMFDYLLDHKVIDPEVIGDADVIGHWEFVPAGIAVPGIAADMALLY